MRKFILILLTIVALGLSSCQEKGVARYVVVGKEYVQEGVCHDSNREHKVVNIVYVPHVHVPVRPAPHHHRLEAAVFTIYLANKDKIISVNVDRQLYSQLNVLDAVERNAATHTIKLLRKKTTSI